MDSMIRPNFGKTFRGFDEKQVIDYISRLESEFQVAEYRQKKAEQEAAALRTEIENLKKQAKKVLSDSEQLRSKNDQMSTTIHELEAALQEEKDTQNRLRRELKKIQESAEESEHNADTIKAAILNAQRMGEIIVQEAKQHAADLQEQADEAYAEAEKKMDKLIQETNAQADRMIDSAQQRCIELQQDYDHILMDVSGFKAEMIALYRRHLELLYKLPDNGMINDVSGETEVIESAGK